MNTYDVDFAMPSTLVNAERHHHAFIRLRNRLGLKTVWLHDLRHFATTRLLGAGIPVRTVSGRLGHANAATTLGVYAHFLAESDREAANALEEILSHSRSGVEAMKQRSWIRVKRMRPGDIVLKVFTRLEGVE